MKFKTNKMTTEQIIEQLTRLRLVGMADRLKTMMDTNFTMDDVDQFTLLGMLLEAQVSYKEQRTLELLLKNARLRKRVLPSSVICVAENGLSKEKWVRLCECNFIKQKTNLIIVGKTGVGKSFCASALAYQACTKGYKTLFLKMNKLIEELASARLQNTYLKLLSQISRVDLLIIDDLGIKKIDNDGLNFLFDIIEERTEAASTIFTSQYPVKNWYDIFNQNSTLAEAFLDRIIGNAEKVELKGESRRRRLSQKSIAN